PPGSTLDETARTTEVMRRTIESVEGVERILVIGGASPLGDIDIRRANVVVILERLDNGLKRKLLELAGKLPVIGSSVPLPSNNGRLRPQVDIEAEVFQRLATVPDILAFKLGGPGAGGRPVSYNILSPNEADLQQAIVTLERGLADEPLLANIATESSLPRPEIRITPRAEEAARLGVTTQAIAAIVRVATIG